MSKDKKKKLSGIQKPHAQIAQDYELSQALAAIRKGGYKIGDAVEGTRSDIRIGSLNVNILSNPETNTKSRSDTETNLTGRYVTEQYVQALVNNLKADQQNSSSKLLDHINVKIEGVNEKIENCKKEMLSSNGFWVGVSILIAVIGIGATIFIYHLQERNEDVNTLSNSIKEQGLKVEAIEEELNTISDTIKVLEVKIKANTKEKKK